MHAGAINHILILEKITMEEKEAKSGMIHDLLLATN